MWRLIAAFVSTVLAVAQTSLPPSHQPSRPPDRIVLTWAGDPCTMQSVSWRTDTSVRKTFAEISIADDGPGFVRTAEQVNGTLAAFSSDLGDAHVHTVRFLGLKPGTAYLYRVGDGSTWSEWHQFRTPSKSPAPLVFLYSGDAQNEILSHWSRVIRTGILKAPDAQFIIHAGDLVNHGRRDQLWGEWFRAAAWLNAAIPSLPAPGNHEYAGSEGPRALTPHWRAQFDLPENGPVGLEESCYYLDIQGVRIVVLNSSERQQEQAHWLDTILAENRNTWTVLAFHHPIFSSAKGRDNKELRELWQPVFDKHRVDLVLQGHDHTYARSDLVKGNAGSADGGTVYVVSVAGPKMYRLDREPWMKRAAEDKQLIQVIRVNGDRLVFEAWTAAGRLYDSFELVKRRGESNVLRDGIPRIPERLRPSS